MAAAVFGFRLRTIAAASYSSEGREQQSVAGVQRGPFLNAIWVSWRTHLPRLSQRPVLGGRPDVKSSRNAVLHAALVTGAFIVVGLLHQTVPHTSIFWHNLFQWLYYGLAAIAAARFGLRGGLFAAAASLAGYLPHLTEPDTPIAFENYCAQFIALLVTSAVIGRIADRERHRRAELNTALNELGQAHRDLQAGVEQLRSAARLAAVGQLAASLAHEIRNPLASIQGAVSALDHSGAADETCREMRQIIWKECGRLRNLLTGLLDFARPRATEYKIVDAAQMLDSVIALVGPAAAKNGITLRKEIAPGVASLECDPEQLTQVILNLALNAVQAMPGGGEIVMSARRSGASLLVQIRDQGIGISAANVDRIFDPFFTTKQSGTGLGLAVAYRIVSDHGGGITVERNADKGMTFSVRLPLARPEKPFAETANGSGRKPLSEIASVGR